VRGGKTRSVAQTRWVRANTHPHAPPAMERERIASRRHAEVAPADKRKHKQRNGFCRPGHSFSVACHGVHIPAVAATCGAGAASDVLRFPPILTCGLLPRNVRPSRRFPGRAARRPSGCVMQCFCGAAPALAASPRRSRQHRQPRPTLGQSVAEPVQSTVPNEAPRRPRGRCYAAVPARSARNIGAVRQRVASRYGPFLRLIIVNAFLKWWVTA
jgi:hypothetical protein